MDTGDNYADIDGAGQALFQFVRHWSRRSSDPSNHGEAAQGRAALVLEAVRALESLPEVTVNNVAAELGLDQSGASRMVAHAVAKGLLLIDNSTSDARRRIIKITDAGRAFLISSHQWQDAMFVTLTADWSSEERVALHQFLLRLLARSSEFTHNR